jgi:hypothetical protein
MAGRSARTHSSRKALVPNDGFRMAARPTMIFGATCTTLIAALTSDVCGKQFPHRCLRLIITRRQRRRQRAQCWAGLSGAVDIHGVSFALLATLALFSFPASISCCSVQLGETTLRPGPQHARSLALNHGLLLEACNRWHRRVSNGLHFSRRGTSSGGFYLREAPVRSS